MNIKLGKFRILSGLLTLLLLALTFSADVHAAAIINIIKSQNATPSCPVPVGTELRIDYTLIVRNSGNMAAELVKVSDKLPSLTGQQAQFIPGSLDSDVCSFNPGINAIECTFPNVLPGQAGQRVVSFSVMFTPTSAGIISNVAIAAGGTGTCTFTDEVCGGQFGGCSPNVCQDIPPPTPSPPPPTPGPPPPNDDISNLQLGNSFDNENVVFSGETLMCPFSDDPCPLCPPNLCNLTPPANSNTVSCSVIGDGNIEIVDTTNPPSEQCLIPDEPNPLTYEISLSNPGTDTADPVEFINTLPAGVNIMVNEILVNGSPGDCSQSSNIITCDLGSLGPGDSKDVSIETVVTPSSSDVLVNNTRVEFNVDGTELFNESFVENCVEADCEQLFDGTFEGITRFVRDDPAFAADENVVDATILEIDNVSLVSLNGVFNADWLQDVSIDAGCSSVLANFDGQFQDICDETATITGQLRFLPPNEIEIVNGRGNDCKGGYDFFTDALMPLIREGTEGNSSAVLQAEGPSNIGAQAGCALAAGNKSLSPAALLIYLLLPAIFFIRRLTRNRMGRVLVQAAKMTRYLFLFIVPIFVIAFTMLPGYDANAQTILKKCENAGVDRSLSGNLDFICSDLKSKEGSLNDEQRGLLARCEQIINNESGELCSELANSITDPITIINELLSIQSQNLFKTIRSRLGSLRAGGGSNVSLAGDAMRNFDNESKSLLASASDVVPIAQLSLFNQAEEASSGFSKFGTFLNGAFNFGDRDTTANRDGYDFNIFEIIAGVDYRLTNYLILGVSFNYSYTDVDKKGSRGSITSNAFYGTLYGSAYWDNFYLDGLVSLGGANYDIRRDFDNSVEKGSPDGFLYKLAIALGYDINYNSFSISPYGRLNYAQNNLDSYNESTVSGEPGLGLNFSKQKAKSFTSALGTQGSYAWSTNWGVVFPQVLFEWIHEFENNPDTVVASFDAVSNSGFRLRPPSIDSDYFNVGGGIYTLFPRGFSIFIYYERTVGYRNLNPNYITGGVRKEF